MTEEAFFPMPANPNTGLAIDDDSLWYKDAIIYELHVRAFHDADDDGVGDFRGLTEKLEYLQDLGITAIWLLPFCPSPLKDDGYDISDYTSVHPAYGTLRDFKVFLQEAQQRGLRVITEFVVNHTSDQHAWFRRARTATPGSRTRDFYVWSDTPQRYQEARIIFKDSESSNWTWDPVAKAYYWHRFYSHQPDLNYDNPQVRKAILEVLDFWLGLGVDGLRLDAVPYLYEREGTNCENLPETHAFLKEMRRHVDQQFKRRMLLGEANQWPEDAIMYFGNGDECHTAFHFPLMPRMFMATSLEDRFPIIEILQQTPPIPATCQWTTFLRNHDEMTLEMVTDQERDYLYRVYATDPQMRLNQGIRRRLAPLLGNNRRKIELMNGLLFSLPGSPVVYYGDELGMGDNVYLGDRNGVRTPMQWSGNQNAGFSRANPQKLFLPVIINPEYHYEAINVEVQQNNPNSLLWWMKRLMALRKRYKAFGRGSIEFLYPENQKVLAFIRRYEDETILVVANLSRLTQCAEVGLSAFKGMVPTELFGQTAFPSIGERPYFVTLGPHAFYWFILQPPRMGEAREGSPQAEVPMIEVSGKWHEVFHAKQGLRGELERVLPRYLTSCRWFGGKARTIQSAKMTDAIRLSDSAFMTFVQVEYADVGSETYLLPLTFSSRTGAEPMQNGEGVVARLKVIGRGRESEGFLIDGAQDKEFANLLLGAIGRHRQFKGTFGQLTTSSTRMLRGPTGRDEERLTPTVLPAEQSNTSIRYGDRFILKLFRRLESGTNPELEIGRFLTGQTAFANIPPMAGAIEYHQKNREPLTVALLQGFVPNQGDAWCHTLEALEEYYERVLTQPQMSTEAVPADRAPLDLVDEEIPAQVIELLGSYQQTAQLLGGRTAELHVALASERSDLNFSPEPFSWLDRHSLYQSLRSLTVQTFQLLRKDLTRLPDQVREEAQNVLSRETEILASFQRVAGRKLTALRIRCHGDYHLGQVLYTGKDFIIIDFEGEPARSINERRLKRSPLHDVAGMLRSFHYAAYAALLSPSDEVRGSAATGAHNRLAIMEPWAQRWYVWISTIFLKAYLGKASQNGFLPNSREELRMLLDAYLLEKAIYELSYELNNRPDWLRIPLQGIKHLITPGMVS